MAAADSIAVYHSDDGLGNRADCLMEVKDIEAGHSLLVDISAYAFDFLIAARAKALSPAPVSMITPMSDASRQ